MSSNVREVAKKAGVSVGSVSRFLNGYNIKEQTREKIQMAIDELGFKESLIIKAMRTKKSMTVGVLVSIYNSDYFMEIIRSLEKVFHNYKYNLILSSFENNEHLFNEKLDLLVERNTDGIIIFPSGIIKKPIDKNIPVVLIDELIPGFNTDAVVIDNRNVCFRAIEYLIQHNHRKIGIVTGKKNTYVSEERLQGCLDAFEIYHIPYDKKYMLAGDFTVQGGYIAAKKLLNMPYPPTAIFSNNLDMSLGAVLAIQEKNIKIPDDLSFFSFDKFLSTELIKPPLSLIEQPLDRIGQEAANLLIKRIHGDHSGYPQIITLNAKMIIRDSVRDL